MGHDYTIRIDAKPGVKTILFDYAKANRQAFLCILHRVIDAIYEDLQEAGKPIFEDQNKPGRQRVNTPGKGGQEMPP